MTHNPDLKRSPDESLDQFLVRLGGQVEIQNINWAAATELLNAETDEEYSESKWRKDFASFLRWKGYLINELVNEDEYLNGIKDASLTLQKETVKFRDQKREYNAEVRRQARFEHLRDEIHESILQLEKLKPLYFHVYNGETTNKHGNVLFSDWHYGSDFKNSLNTYNPAVFRLRLERLISKVIKYGKFHNIDSLTIGGLGDFLSGAIHVSTRVQSSEDVVTQIQVISESLAESIAELSKHFRQIKYINIIGNHARLISNKTESIFTENLENLIPWYLESRLRDFENVSFERDCDGYYIDERYDPPHVYVHGDLDQVSSVVKSLPQMLGIIPKYVFMGHIHHNTVKDHGKTKVISNGCLCGVDDYAISKRFYAEPYQIMHVFKDNGKIEHTIDIDFDI